MRSVGLAAAILVALTTACGDAGTDPFEPQDPQLASSGSTLIECPINTTRSTSATIDGLGGTVSLDGHSITLPAGAVLLPTEITLTVPASNYVEIEITANDQESFDFEEPVSITISYERCTRSNILASELTAWQIDPVTKALLEHMGGTDDKTARTVTFPSGHLSGFAIAN